MKTFCCAAVAILLLLTPAILRAQSTSASVTGRITDPSRAIVPGAKIEAINTATNIHYNAQTDRVGSYVLANLPPGEYRLEVEKYGFKSIVKPNVVLHVQDVLEINFQMQLGSSSETVTVTGGAPLLDKTDATVSTVVDRAFVENLPMNGRSFQSLLLLTPGVVMMTVQSGNLGQFSINGQRADSNNVTVDGVSANFGLSTYYLMGESLGGAVPATNVLGGYNSLVSVDALQEFRIQTSTYAPEFGRQPGGQVSIVTRSGTNEFHGDAFDYLRNDLLDARDYFNTTGPKPALRQNDFGGVVGGPIARNRAFFFFSYEGLRLRKPNVGNGLRVPSLATRQAASPSIAPLLDMFPLPTPGGQTYSDGSADEIASWSDPGTVNATSLRVDTKLTQNLSLFARYDYSPSQIDARGGGANGIAALSEVDSNRMNIETITGGITWLISPKSSNEVRLNYSRDKGDQMDSLTPFNGAIVPPDSYFFPSGYSFKTGTWAVCVIAGCNSVNHEYFELGHWNNSLNQAYDVVDNYSLIEGAHALKFGLDWRRNSMFFWPFSYFSEPYFSSFSQALSGTAFESQLRVSVPSSVRNKNLGLYAEDTWKPTPRLSLTYGLRWDMETPMLRNGGLPIVTAANLFQPDLSKITYYTTKGYPYPVKLLNFAPRLGVAYELQGKSGWETVLRGGWGIFYNLISQSAGALIYGWAGYPISAGKVGFGNPFPFTPSFAAPPAITFDPNTGGGVEGMYNPEAKSPYTHEFTVSVQQSLGANQAFDVTYVGALGENLARTALAWPIGPTGQGFSYIWGLNSGRSNYNALQLQFKRNMVHGLQAMASYNWSHSLDNSSEDSFGYGSDWGNWPTDSPSFNWGPSLFDIRQTASAAVGYDIPTPRVNRFVSTLFGHWGLDNIFSARSSPPSDIGGFFYGALAGTTSDFMVRPDRVPGVPLYLDGSQYPGGRAINPAAFTAPPSSSTTAFIPARPGNFGRNALRNFPAYQWDMAIRRTFNLSERMSLQFRLEMFNALNHPNFGFFGGTNSGTQLVSINYLMKNGAPIIAPMPPIQVTQTLGPALQGAYGGVNPLYSIGGARSMQAALKLTF